MTNFDSKGDSASVSLAASARAYEQYDPETLEPRNETTRIRLAELGWSKVDFEGKTVLDIGAGGGLLSIHAHKLGAASVRACDAQDALVALFGRVVEAKHLSITVSKASLSDLRVPEDQADVVLFMEVLHWAVAQGTPLEDVIGKLVGLTRECLFIEFPWSVEEPSIRVQTKLSEADYAPDRVLDLLSRHFADVKIARFMRYFGFKSPAKRVLVRASAKRVESVVLMKLPESRPLDVSLPNARHKNRIIQSPQGYFFLKQLAPESRLRRADPGLVTAFFDDLHSRQIESLVLPVRLGGSYLASDGADSTFMAFPLVGGLARQPTISRRTLSLDRLLEFLSALRGELSSIASAHVEAFREPQAIASLLSIVRDPNFWRLPACSGDWKARIEDFVEVLDNSDEQDLNRIQHGDVQTGNLLARHDGRLVLVDLDSLSLGTPYSDGLTALTWFGADALAFRLYAERYELAGEREIRDFDIALSALRGLHWLHTVTKGRMLEPNSRTITCFLAGFDGLMKFDETLRHSRQSKGSLRGD